MSRRYENKTHRELVSKRERFFQDARNTRLGNDRQIREALMRHLKDIPTTSKRFSRRYENGSNGTHLPEYGPTPAFSLTNYEIISCGRFIRVSLRSEKYSEGQLFDSRHFNSEEAARCYGITGSRRNEAIFVRLGDENMMVEVDSFSRVVNKYPAPSSKN